MKRCSVVALVLTCSSPALAEESFLPLRTPPPLPHDRVERPEREPDDVPRREIEITATGTAGFLGCSGNAPQDAKTGDPCAHLGPATGIDAGLLYRPTPMFALGGHGSYERFDWSASAGASTASFTHVALLARAYFVNDGTLDVWAGADVGGGWLAMHAPDASEIWRNGVSFGASLGFDIWLSAHLRIGALASFTWQPGSGAESCAAGVCLDGSSALARVPDHVIRTGAAITFALGDEL